MGVGTPTKSFSVSIRRIDEVDVGGVSVRSILISDLNFSSVSVPDRNNKLFNYSAHLDNGAIIYVIVSSLFLFNCYKVINYNF